MMRAATHVWKKLVKKISLATGILRKILNTKIYYSNFFYTKISRITVAGILN